MIDKKAIEYHIKGLLVALGEDPNREGLIDTPKRVANMYEEVFEGMNYTNDEIAFILDKTFEKDIEIVESSKDIVLMKDIEAFSFCEHHIALIYNMKIAVAYVPNDRVIGLSKIARAVEMACRRLQLQERIGTDIAYIIQKIINTEDVAVIIEAEHSCMTARGIKKRNAKTVTTTFRGRFVNEIELYQKLMILYNSR